MFFNILNIIVDVGIASVILFVTGCVGVTLSKKNKVADTFAQIGAFGMLIGILAIIASPVIIIIGLLIGW